MTRQIRTREATRIEACQRRRRAAPLQRAAAGTAGAVRDAEQLRALSHGLRIKVGLSETPPPRGVDTEDDLAAVSALLAAR